MKTLQKIQLGLAAAISLAAGPLLHAQVAGDVAVDNDPISIISVTNTTLAVVDPVAGAIKGGTATTSAVGSVLRITTNQTNRKITVLRAALPTGVSMTVECGSHTSTFTGGTETTVGTTATDFITGISNLASNVQDASGIPLIYKVTLGQDTPSGDFTANLTFTITAGS